MASGLPNKKIYIKNDAGHFICPHCGEIKEKQNTMFYHMQSHEGQLPYECNVCKKQFVQKQELLLHKQRRHPEKEEVPPMEYYYCPWDDCDFADPRKGNVRTHCMRSHARAYINPDMVVSTTAGYDCGLCKKSCGSITALYYHFSTCLIDHGAIPPRSELAKALEMIN